ncbi:cytochrome P450 [Sanghuangporus baumii]|uniref:Cytochrome P450 n=1 Tax=Sanghuangporus baumii TaxID=108892 RepID=A0A9Q5I0C4_SANBA|nr:cytochrome P450 [Sanghuangporus baumii]
MSHKVLLDVKRAMAPYKTWDWEQVSYRTCSGPLSLISPHACINIHSPEHCSFPPGPKGLPLVGNIFDMPSSEEWVKAREWGEKYGDLVMVKNFGTRYLFVNSYEAAFDLLEKRGNKYSSRPVIPMFELEEWTWFTAVMPYGEEHRHSRQFLHQFFHKAATSRFHEVQVTSTHKLLLAILENPAKFAEHLHYSAGELIIRIGYGYQAKAKNDPYIELAERALHAATEAEGFFLVNALPILKYLPEWFPGAHFLNTAKIGRELSRQMRSRIFAMAKKLIENGKALTSMTSTLLEQNTDIDGQVTHEDLIARTVGTIYIAGTDTTSSVLVKFIQAMVLYPETMRQGQAELDKVIGMDTLPTMDDRPKLPYINAICKELLRYQPTAPLAIAHYTTEDDYYNGFYIPAGTIILPNVWAMLMDPKTYPEPDKFKPDRWLPSDGAKQPLQSNKMAFGFGRRICPGRHFAEDSIFIQVASILAVFDIQMAVDANGDPIVPKEEYISAFIRKPMPFKCKITPRSDRSAELIQRAIELISPVHETPKAN